MRKNRPGDWGRAKETKRFKALNRLEVCWKVIPRRKRMGELVLGLRRDKRDVLIYRPPNPPYIYAATVPWHSWPANKKEKRILPGHNKKECTLNGAGR